MICGDHGTLRHGVASPWRSRPLPPGDNTLAKLLANTDWPYCYATCMDGPPSTQSHPVSHKKSALPCRLPQHSASLGGERTTTLYSASGRAANTANDRHKMHLWVAQPAAIGMYSRAQTETLQGVQQRIDRYSVANQSAHSFSWRLLAVLLLRLLATVSQLWKQVAGRPRNVRPV